MARLVEEKIVITISKLVKNNETPNTSVAAETLEALEQVAQELLGNDVVVEASQE